MPHSTATQGQTEKQLTGRRGRGFTLIELLVVVTIIGLVVGLVTAGLFSVRKGARIKQTLALLKQADTLAQAYEEATGGRIVAHTDYFTPGEGRILTGANTEDPFNFGSRGGSRLQEIDWLLAPNTYNAPDGVGNALNFNASDVDGFKASSIERFLWAA